MVIYSIPEDLKTIIFDIDSTLYTNKEYEAEQIDIQIRHFADLRKLSHKVAREMVNSYRKEWSKLHDGKKLSLANTMIDLGVSIEESIAWRKKLINPEQFLSYDEKLVASLTELSNSYALICVTNNPVSIAQRTLEAIGADILISEIIGLDSCSISKPDQKMYELAAVRTSAQIEQCLSVGDRYDIDIALPLEMGMGGILVENVDDVYKLKKILDFSYSANEK